MDTVLGSHAPGILLATAVVLLVVLTATRRLEFVAAGYLVTGVGFLVFAGQVNVAPSRYYLPTATLGALAVVRLIARLESVRVGALVAGALLVLAASQVQDARGLVAHWASGEREQERIVRVVGGLRAAGCNVRLAGLEVELIEAMPVLIPVADPKPTPCDEGRRFVAVLNWHFGEDRTDPAIVGCGVAPRMILRNDIGRVMECDR